VTSFRAIAFAILYATSLLVAPDFAHAVNVVTYHNSNTRHGAYIEPTFTQTAATKMKLDSGFSASVTGNVYAQPLFWHPTGTANGEVIVVTESNQVSALNSVTGAKIWSVQLPASVPLSALGCGNVNPEGIHGTPVINPTTGTLYLDALVEVNGVPNHTVYALSAATGQTLAGWPLNVDTAMKTAGAKFEAFTQGERSGALIYDGKLYFTYAGRYGDCDPYYGTVIEINPATKSLVGQWQTRASGGGIWAQGGISSDGTSLFVTTGNTMGANSWMDGEAIVKLKPGLAHSTNTADFFTPKDWLQLDESDLDLGGTEALPLDIATTGGKTVPRVIAFGKDGNAYLANRTNLGGIGHQLATMPLSNTVIVTAPTVYQTSTATMVAFTNYSAVAPCSGNVIMMISIAPSGKAPISPAWCAAFNGLGSPILTTTDGTQNPIIWVVGAEGDNVLHGFNATTGKIIFTGTKQLGGLHHFQTLIEAEGRMYVAGDNTLYAYTYTGG